MAITLNGTTGITTPDITSSGALGVDASAPDNSLVVDSSGNVGIGTSSPSAPIDVVSNSSAIGTRVRGRSSDSYGVLEFTNNGASAETARIAADSAGNLIFSNTGVITERMRIDSAGRVTMPYQPYFVAYRNTSVWETYSSQVVVWTSTQFNVGNHYSTSTGAFTAPVDGVYFFNAQIYTLNTLVYSNLYIRVNGASDNRLRFSYKQDNGAVDNTHHLTVVQKLNTNDTVDLLTSGDLHTGFSRFSGYLIG